MSARHLIRLAIAAGAIGLAASAEAAGPATVNQSSSPLYWGTTGTNAVMILRYDTNATLPLLVTNLQITNLGDGSNITTALYNCGTIVKQGDTFVGHQIQPGQDCYLSVSAPTGSSIYGMASVSDGSASVANVNMYVRTGIEIRDGAGNVLDHVEVH